MFEIGTKVIVLASSRRTGLGPKRGSVGYISKINQIMYIRPKNLTVFSCTVYFYRFGFEKKIRAEKKKVLALFPYCFIRPDETRKLINKLNGSGPEGELGYKNLFKAAAIKMDTCVLGPCFSEISDLTACSDKEFYCWMSSILTSHQFVSWIETSYNDGPIPEAISKTAFARAHNLSRSKKKRKEEISTYTRQAILSWLNTMRCIYIINTHKRDYNFCSRSIESGYTGRNGKFLRNRAIKVLEDLYFKFPLFEKVKHTLCFNHLGDDRVFELMNLVEASRFTVLEFSDRLVCGGYGTKQ